MGVRGFSFKRQFIVSALTNTISMIKRFLLRNWVIAGAYPNLAAMGCGRWLTAQFENGTVEPPGNMATPGVLVAGTRVMDARSRDSQIVYLRGTHLKLLAFSFGGWHEAMLATPLLSRC